MALGGPLDYKNIGLAKLLYELRQHLDVYCLIAVNAADLNTMNGSFFGHLQQTELQAIGLNICKIYEKERRFPLNSVLGVWQHLIQDAQAEDEPAVRSFVAKHKGPSGHSAGIAVKLTAELFLEERRADLNRFKEFRDKKVAHSEYKIELTSLPSYAAMEDFFEFGADFYTLVAEAFLGVGAAEFHQPVKVGFERVLRKLGLSEVRTEML